MSHGFPVPLDLALLLSTKVLFKKTQIATLCAVLVALVIAQQLGVFHAFADPQQLKKTLIALGPWGYVVFVVSYATLQPFGLPGTIFVVAAPLIWPWPVAFCLSMVGTMAASVVGFAFARFIGRDWVAERIPERFRKYDDMLAERAFATVFLLRLVFWMPPFLHAFFGVSKVRFSTHFWASLAGYALPLFLMSFFGQRSFDFVSALSLRAWIGLAVGTLVLAAAIYLRPTRSNKLP
jgi:uncharacterized membrane protein YdjX (TVP38/TMEM64 family)